MSMIKYHPPFSLIRDIDRFFGFNEDREALVPIDLIENDDSFVIKANLPGVKKDNINIEASNEFVEIKAEVKDEVSEEKDEDDVKYLHRERYVSNFSRRINFRTPINAKDAKTSFEDGVLTITIPKAEESKLVKLSL